MSTTEELNAAHSIAAHDIDGENIPDLGFDQATNEIAILLRENGEPVDILFFDIDSGEYRTALETVADDGPTSRDTTPRTTVWAGFDNLSAPVVRLNSNIHEWLSDSCSGVVNISRFNRGHMAKLAQAPSIVCSDVRTAMAAWDYGFGAKDSELDRFTIDGVAA
jgi:hypothetical protein